MNVDGTVSSIKAKSKQEAIDISFKNSEFEEFEDFEKELNFIQYEEDDEVIVNNYQTNEIRKYPKGYKFLENYSKIQKIKKPSKELEEEFDYV